MCIVYNKTKISVLLFFILLQQYVLAQNKYWIFFKNKPIALQGINYVSETTIHNRKLLGLDTLQWADLPLDKSYLDHFARQGISVICQSKWLNGISVCLNDQQLSKVRSQYFVRSAQRISIPMYMAAIKNEPAGNPWLWAFQAMEGAVVVKQKLTAKGVKIGVIDAGFKGADTNQYIKRLVQQNLVVAMRDFVNPSITSLFNPEEPGAVNHGMYVLKMLAGYNKEKNLQCGLATDASFYLARTDDPNREFRGEEDYWLRAVEWLDSLGVRLVNSSLGYSRDFDESSENYSPGDMNGHTSTIAKAAQAAIEKRGMIIVSSIGNEGRDSTWEVITTPSDAPDVISVGAADIDYWFKPSFSSIGPPSLSYVKPTIVCPTADGTSFAAPFITGLIGCMLERKPGLTSREVVNILQKAGHLYPYSNNFIGYGLPTADRLLKLLDDPSTDFHRDEEISVTEDSIELDLNKYRQRPGETLTFFFKKDKYAVAYQAISARDKIVLRRKKNIGCITIASRTKVVELIWK